MTQENDLVTLLPVSATVKVCAGTPKEEEVTVSPIRYKQFTAIVGHVIAIRSTVMREILVNRALKADAEKAGDTVEVDDEDEFPIDFLKLLDTNGEDIGEIVRISIGKSAAWMEDLEITDLLRLAAAVIKVNKDFFSQRLAPVIKELVAGLKKSSGGETSSKI